MTDEQARVATIVETTECGSCGAAKTQPCFDPKRGRVWLASVHYTRRDNAARIRNQNPLLWRRLLAQAKEMTFEQYAEYIRTKTPAKP